MKSIITFSFPEVRVVSSTFIKISKNAKKVYLISHFLNKLFYLQFQVDQYCPQNVII